MTKWLGDKRVVGGLALLACLFVYSRVVVPLLPQTYDETAPDDVFEEDALVDDSDVGAPSLKLATARYDLRNIDISMLFFNEHPKRDPFVISSTSAAPLAEVQVKPDEKTSKRATVSTLTLPTLVAVIQSDDRTAAVIGDQIVAVGDRVGKFSVQEIQRDRVILAVAATNRTYELGITP